MSLRNSVSQAPKQKRVTLLLETSRRTRTIYGEDFYSQVLHLRLDGMAIHDIAQTLHCGDDIITSIITLWQTQVALKEGEGWQPKARNPRRVKTPRPKDADFFPNNSEL